MPDWFRDSRGRVHIIRSSPGYDEALVGLSEADKEYLRGGEKSYTVQSPYREQRIQEHAERKKAIEEGKIRPYVKRETREVQENRFRPRAKRKLV